MVLFYNENNEVYSVGQVLIIWLACVASVSVGLGSNKGISGVLPARKLVQEPKKDRARGGGRGR